MDTFVAIVCGSDLEAVASKCANDVYLREVKKASNNLGLFQKLSSGGGGPQTLFCPVGGGCFVDNVSEGWGVGR